MNVPTDDDWSRSESWGLDENYAYENFHGKTVEEAVRLFEDNALHYQEDLMYMPGRVFAYYLRAYVAYLASDAAAGDTDGANGFVGLIDFKTEHAPGDVLPSWPEIEPTLRLIVERQERGEDYEDEWIIYGSFRARIHEIAKRGFAVSFDTATPEVVPGSVALEDMGPFGRVVSWPVAVQLLRRSGVAGLDDASTKRDLVRVLGLPDAARVDDHPTTVRYQVKDWARYDRPGCSLHFAFEGDAIAYVNLAGRGAFIPPNVPGGPTQDDFKRAARAVWDSLSAPGPRDASKKEVRPAQDDPETRPGEDGPR